MTTAQKIIKNLAIAFAIFLVVTIISTILGGIYGLVTVLGIKKDENTVENMKEVEFESVSSFLDINLKYTNLKIQVGDKFLAKTNSKNIECIQDGEKLKVTEKSKLFSKRNNEEIVIYIPENMELDVAKIDTGAGKVDIENIIADRLKMNLGAGDTVIKNIVSKDAKIDTGAGKFTINSGKIRDLNFDIGVGETNITSKILGKSEIDTGIGEVKLKLIGSKETYKVKVSKGIGDVKVDNKSVSDNEIIGDGENTIEINGGIGNIQVDFEDNDKI